MFDNWFLEEWGETIAVATDAGEMQRLAKGLRQLADAADARAIELALQPENFIMRNVTERVQ